MNSTFYDSRFYFDTLMWSDVFEGPEDFIDKVESVGGVTDSGALTELYEILSLKYVRSHTRYTDEFAFIMAIKRELYTVFPSYLERKNLYDDMMKIEIQEVMKGVSQLRNRVENMDEPITQADKVAIEDLSTEQESVRLTTNKLDAIKAKYNVLNRNYLAEIYKACDQLFRVILSDDVSWLYPQGGE